MLFGSHSFKKKTFFHHFLISSCKDVLSRRAPLGFFKRNHMLLTSVKLRIQKQFQTQKPVKHIWS